MLEIRMAALGMVVGCEGGIFCGKIVDWQVYRFRGNRPELCIKIYETDYQEGMR